MIIRTREDLALALDQHTVVAIRRLPFVPWVVQSAISKGELVAVLPGIYARADSAREPLVRMAALRARDPDAIFTGLSAAGLLWNSAHFGTTVTATGRTRSRVRGYALERRAIDPEWVHSIGGFLCTGPELTAVDLIPEVGGQFIDDVLRRSGDAGRAALATMWRALEAHPDRRGNKHRRAVLHESRDLPWSEAERLAHTILREADVTGWKTNFHVCLDGRHYFIDIAFPKAGLAIEIDGYGTHSSRAAFENDRVKHNALEKHDWDVLHHTWRSLNAGELLPSIRPWLVS